MRSCEACGKELPAESRRSKRFCDGSCRKRGARTGLSASKVVELPQDEAERGTVYLATLNMLEKADRVDSPAGQAALVLAFRLDTGGRGDTGSAVAAMVKELRAAVAEATAGVPDQADAMDELKAQREKRLGA